MERKQYQIINLADAPEHMEEVSRWLWEQWSRAKGFSPEDILYRTRHACQRDTVPQMLVAVMEGRPVGTVALWLTDVPTRLDLTPWMATLYVKPELRNYHIGQALQKASIEAAEKLRRYDWLYLITELDGYYEKTGWELVEHVPVGHGETEKIYRYPLKR